MSKSNSVGTKLNIGTGVSAKTVGGLTSINGIEISAENVSRLQVNRMPGRVSGIEWNSGISSGSSMSVINGVTSSKYTLRIPFRAFP